MSGLRDTGESPATVRSDVGAVILAGTYHWNGSAFEDLQVRPLLPVAQRPLIEYVLTWLKDNGVREATICGNGSTAAIRQHLQDGSSFAVDVRYHEDRTPRGAAGCVKDASASSSAQTIIVADGTAIPMVDLAAVIDHHHTTGAVMTIVADRRRSAGTGDEMLRPVGIYVFDRSVLDAVPASSFQDIKEALIPALYRTGQRVEVFPVNQASPRVMDAATYLAANRWMIQRLQAGDPKAYESGDVAESAWVDPDAKIVGPVMLGPGVRVMAGATIVGPASIGEGTVIEPGAVVARSVIWNHCTVERDAMVDNSIVADKTVIAAGETVANAIRVARPERKSRRRLLPQRVPALTATGVAKPAWS